MGEIDFSIQALRKRLDELEMSYKMRGPTKPTEIALIEFKKQSDETWKLIYAECNPPE